MQINIARARRQKWDFETCIPGVHIGNQCPEIRVNFKSEVGILNPFLNVIMKPPDQRASALSLNVTSALGNTGNNVKDCSAPRKFAWQVVDDQ